MKKILLITFLLLSFAGSSQIKLDALAFQGKVTTTIRNAYNVPTGQVFLIWNTTTGQFEYAEDDDVWKVLGGGAGDMLKSENLSGLENNATALTNLGLTATAAELNYTDGVTSNIQTQFNKVVRLNDTNWAIDSIGQNFGMTRGLDPNGYTWAKLNWLNFGDTQSAFAYRGSILYAENGKFEMVVSQDTTGLFVGSNRKYIFDTTYDNPDDVPRKSNIDAALAAFSGVTDGNKGDISVFDGGTSWGINNGVITGVKIQDATITGLKIQDGVITTAKILDGTILNADVNASAAIAATKIAIDTLGIDYVGVTLQTFVNETDTKINSISTILSEPIESSGDVNITGSFPNALTTTINNDKVTAEMLKATNAPTDKYVASFDNATGGVTWTVPPIINHPDTGNSFTSIYAGTRAAITAAALPSSVLAIPTDAPNTDNIMIACSDLTTNITTGTSKAYFRMPFAATLTGVKVSLIDAGTVTGLTVDINEAGVSVLSTKLTTDATEATSATAATAAVISDSALANDAIITIDFDAVPTAGKGVIVTLYLEY